MDYKKTIQDMKNQAIQDVVNKTSVYLIENRITNVKMTDIAAVCNVGVATLYRYFGTKNNLVIEVGIKLWRDIIDKYEKRFLAENFYEKSAIEQIKKLLNVFVYMFDEEKGFLQFVHDFDYMVITEDVDEERLKRYEESVLNVSEFFTVAYTKGVKDGSFRDNIDFRTFYLLAAHMLRTLAEKFLTKPVFSTDNYNTQKAELEMATDVLLHYLLS